MELGLSGKKAVVTGATKGIGRAVAEEFLKEGASVTICSRNSKELADTAEGLRRITRSVISVVCDVTNPEQIAHLMTVAAEEMGGIDILVNNAGGAHPGSFESLTDADWQADLMVKLFSQIRCTRAALPSLHNSAAPSVINVNAVYAKYPDPSFFATTVVRASCLSFSKVLAQELGPQRIRVNSVNIGFVNTPQWTNIHAQRAPTMPYEDFLQTLAETEVPLGRFGRADEVSAIVCFLASPRASYITGASVDVAGGMGKYV